MDYVLKSNILRRTLRILRIHSIWPMKCLCEYTVIHAWLVFFFSRVNWIILILFWLIGLNCQMVDYIIWALFGSIPWIFLFCNPFMNSWYGCISCWWLYMLNAYMLIDDDYICWMHICWLMVIIYVECIYVDWWWLYILSAYMLLVMIYVMYIYVVDIFSFMLLVMNMLVQAWIGMCWCGLLEFAWSMFCCCCCCCCCCLSSPIVVGCCGIPYSRWLFGVIWCVYMHQGDDLRDERNLVPHIVESV